MPARGREDRHRVAFHDRVSGLPGGQERVGRRHRRGVPEPARVGRAELRQIAVDAAADAPLIHQRHLTSDSTGGVSAITAGPRQPFAVANTPPPVTPS